MCHKYGAALFVDEAHGTHFTFHPDFPTPALKSGADYTVQSMHKTLGGLYQTALLHSASRNEVDDERVDQMLAMLQSTSPSALFLMSIDAALTETAEHGASSYGALLEMIDDNEKDYKILAVQSANPRLGHLKDLKDIESWNGHLLKEITHFMESYKHLEGKKADVNAWKDVKAAQDEIRRAQEMYKTENK